jgi:hypothetical protein
MLIKLHPDVAQKYAKWLEYYEKKFKQMPKASERYEAYRCAKNDQKPSWV